MDAGSHTVAGFFLSFFKNKFFIIKVGLITKYIWQLFPLYLGIGNIFLMYLSPFLSELNFIKSTPITKGIHFSDLGQIGNRMHFIQEIKISHLQSRQKAASFSM